MQSTMKSSFLDKKKHGESKNTDHLKFTPLEEVPIADRDYGLMWTTKQSLTPFPRIDLGVDANLLKARLSMRRQIEIKRMSEDLSGSPTTIKNTKSAHSSKFVNVDRQLHATPSSIRNILSLGTPHPTKGVVLNAKSLSKRLTDVNEQLKQPVTPMPAISSRTPAKKSVRLRDSPVFNTDDPLLGDLGDGDQLSDISQRVTQIDYSVSASLLSLQSMKIDMSFAERRKRLEEGEFTIARYGKKMGDVMMASDELQHKVVEQGTNQLLAQKANEEIEKYIRSQGLVKTSNDQLIWNHEFDWGSSANSMDSMYQRPHSMAEIYRDIKQRKYVRSQSSQQRDT